MWSASRPGRLYPRERPSTHCTGGWVDPGAGLDRCGKSRLTGIRSPDLPACSESLHRLRYPAPPYICVHINVRKQNICCCLCGVSSVLNTFFSQNCAVIGSSRSEIVFCIFGLSRWIKKCRNKVTVTCMQVNNQQSAHIYRYQLYIISFLLAYFGCLQGGKIHEI